MKIKKMYKRYRLFKSGHAAYVVDMAFKDFSSYENPTSVNSRLTDAYGSGSPVPHFWGSKPSRADWFYVYKPNNQIRLFLRREEQATYLSLVSGES